MKINYTINSAASKEAFKTVVDRLFDEHKYITFTEPRLGVDRSIDQNALFHVWCTEYAAYCLGIHKKEVSPGLLAGTKRIVKKKFLSGNQHCYSWMIHEIINPITQESRKDYTSSASWKTGEMFMVLTWLQLFASEDGLILESKGKFAKLQREHENG